MVPPPSQGAQRRSVHWLSFATPVKNLSMQRQANSLTIVRCHRAHGSHGHGVHVFWMCHVIISVLTGAVNPHIWCVRALAYRQAEFGDRDVPFYMASLLFHLAILSHPQEPYPLTIPQGGYSVQGSKHALLPSHWWFYARHKRKDESKWCKAWRSQSETLPNPQEPFTHSFSTPPAERAWVFI